MSLIEEQGYLAPGLPGVADPPVSTLELLPLRAIERGCLALRGGSYSAVIGMQGINSQLLSAAEKRAYIRRMEELFNAASSPFSFYATVRPHHLDRELRDLERRLKTERNPALLQQHYIQSDHLGRLSQEQNLTRRDYYAAVQVSAGELNDLTSEAEKEKRSALETVKYNFLSAFGSDNPGGTRDKPATPGAKAGKVSIPPPVIVQAGFRAASFASGLRDGARVLEDEEIIRLLGGLCNSPYTHDSRANSVERIAGAAFEEYPGYLKLGHEFIASLYLTDFPRWLHLGSLFEILRFRDIELDLALHAVPLDNSRAADKLRRRESLLFAVKSNESGVSDVARADRIEGLRELSRVLARGDARLFSAGIRAAVRAETKEKCLANLRRVAQRFTELGFKVATPLRNQRRAFLSCLPFGLDLLAKEPLIADRTIHPNLTGENVACLLPNLIINATMPGGIPLGIEKASGGLFTFNRWAKEQVAPHTVVCAFTGSGKSNGQAEEIVQELLRDPELEAFMIDPQGQISLRLAKMVGGTVVDLSPEGKACFNPLDRFSLAGREEPLAKKLEFLIPLFELMLRAELTATERSALGRAVERLYRHFEQGESWLGVIAQNFATHPLYAPLRPYLDRHTGVGGQEQEGIIARLAVIYRELRENFKLPSSGLVEGTRIDDQATRPLCWLAGNRWYYYGEGEIQEPLPDKLPAQKATADGTGNPEIFYSAGRELNPFTLSGPVPARVWYPDGGWFVALQRAFERRVAREGLFDALDDLAARAALRDAFTELCLGMPILSDLLPALVAEGLINLANNLDQYINPKLLGPLFNGYTNVDFASSRFVAFNCLGLDEEVLKATRIYQVINYLWGIARVIRKRRLLVVDEFQLMMETFGSVGQFIKLLFMRGRAFGFAITAIVQNISAFLDNPDGRVCIELASRIILMRQQRGAEHRLRSHFGLTEGQVEALLNAIPGESLVLTSKGWIHMRYLLPPERLKEFETNLPSRTEEKPAADSLPPNTGTGYQGSEN